MRSSGGHGDFRFRSQKRHWHSERHNRRHVGPFVGGLFRQQSREYAFRGLPRRAVWPLRRFRTFLARNVFAHRHSLMFLLSRSRPQIVKIDLKTKDLLTTVEIPGVPDVTSIAFGDPNLDAIYVTTPKIASSGNRASLLRVTGTGSTGEPGQLFDVVTE